MNLRRALSAGMWDAGFASLAAFAVSLEAARRLDPVELGGYALVFTMFLLATVIPAQLVFLPVEVRAATLPRGSQVQVLPSALAYGLPVAAVASLSLGLVTLVMPPEVPADVTTALVVTAAGAAFLSPVQDHLRRMLHVAGASWSAAAVSTAQFAGAVAGLVAVSLAGVAMPWIPFGSLLIANAASSILALALLRRVWHGPAQHLARGDLVRSGRWLLVVGMAPAGAGFAAAAIIGMLAGPAPLGHAEAARVVGQPLLVVAAGLGSVLGPRAVSAAARAADLERLRLRRTFLLVLGAAASGYLALVGLDWAGNPAAALLPGAYAVTGLVAVTVVANLLNGLVFPYRYELFGAGRERGAAGSELLAGLAQTAVSATAAVTGAYARPLGLILLGAVRFALFRRTLGETMTTMPAATSPRPCG